MKKYCEEEKNEKSKKNLTRESIIGLGEDSFRKNYYPELQEKITRLVQINARNRALISTIPDLLLVCNSEGEISALTASNDEGVVLQELIFSDQSSMDMLQEVIQEVKETSNHMTREFRIEWDGKVYFFEARFRQSETGEILIIIRDMTERTLLEMKLKDLAEHDILTHIYNRRHFEDKLSQFEGTSMEKIAMISIDVNGLKFINDTVGHLHGDKIMMAAARILSEVFEPYGHVARIGGDEFGIVLEGLEEMEVEHLLLELGKQVDEYNATEQEGGLSLAYGYSFHHEGIVNTEYLFRDADNNMYQNKLLKKESIRSTFVNTFMKALEAKDYVSEGHVSRMETLAKLMGSVLGLHQDQMDRLVLLTKFHDIGKIGIPDSILKKPDQLTDDEWKVMRTHSNIGERIALEAPEIKDIAHLILKHHERWDGNGYPFGLRGVGIPMECRILAIVDTFDAMTNDRPYRIALSEEKAVSEICNCSGSQFDPELVNVFCRIREKV